MSEEEARCLNCTGREDAGIHLTAKKRSPSLTTRKCYGRGLPRQRLGSPGAAAVLSLTLMLSEEEARPGLNDTRRDMGN